jgi:DNA-binding transcriptional regulator YiaG
MEAENPIKAFRASRSMSLEQFGALFGVHKTTAMRWEEHQVPAARALEIEQKTGIPASQLRPDLAAMFNREAAQ